MKKILIPAYCIGKNPFVQELAFALSRYYEVIVSTEDFLKKKRDYDIINIHWPEEFISDFDSPDDYENLLKDYVNKGCKIVFTRHNIESKLRNTKEKILSKRFYDITFACAHSIIHLGNFSYFEFINNNFFFYKQKHFIVPHFIYDSYANYISESDARKKFSLKENDNVMLVFGNIRTLKELLFVLKVFKTWKSANKKLLISSFPLHVLRFGFLRYRLRALVKQILIFLTKIRRDIVINWDIIPEEQVQYYFKACDVVVIPRIEELNSGILYLSLCFRKPILGPSYGNIGEVLRKVGLPTFNGLNNKSISSTLKSYSALSNQDYDKIFEKATFQYNKSRIIKLYHEAIEKVQWYEIP